MKIFYISHARLPTNKAHGIQIVKTCEALAAAGVSVELIIPARSQTCTENIFSYYNIQTHFTIKTLPFVNSVRFGRIGFLLSQVSFAWSVRKYIQNKKLDFVYGRDEFLLFFLPKKLRIAYEAHTPRWNVVVRSIAHRAYAFITISNGLCRWYQQRGVAKEKLDVIPDAVDPERFKALPNQENCRKKLNLPIDKNFVCYVGHLYRHKGVHVLAEAAKEMPNILVYFVGGTNKDVSVFKEKYDHVKNIRILGHQSYERVPFFLCAADILVLPNTAQDETAATFTSPMKLFEYMASGTPIVASDVPAIREVLDEDTALFVESDNPCALADGIKEMLPNTSSARHHARNVQLEAENYTWNKRAEHIISILENV